MDRFTSIAFAAALLAAGGAQAAISVTTASFTYEQGFDSLAASGNTPVTWVNDSTLPGWSLFNRSGAAIGSYSVGNGGSNTGSFYSFGAAGSAERALGGVASGGAYFGSPASGTVAGYIAAAFTNDSGSVLTGFNLSFAGEQWRNGGNTSAHAMTLEVGTGSSYDGVAWAPAGSAFSWASPVATTTAAALDGNTAGRVAVAGGHVDLNWASGQTVWLRWQENNDVGNDHGLALDDLRFSVTAVPEPATYGLMLAGMLAIGFTVVGRQRRH